jgi:hypothetical protein
VCLCFSSSGSGAAVLSVWFHQPVRIRPPVLVSLWLLLGFVGEICVAVLLKCSIPQTAVVGLMLPSSLITHPLGVVSRKIKFEALFLLGLFLCKNQVAVGLDSVGSSLRGGIGLLGSKWSFCLLCFVRRGCGKWICPCWWSVHSPFHTSINAYTYIFLLFGFAPLRGFAGSVQCVGVRFGFLPVWVGSKTTCSWY